tara:strand:+ start:488 stop:664 length:177 start_codon:yes stop_codon:yes gene_type:complete
MKKLLEELMLPALIVLMFCVYYYLSQLMLESSEHMQDVKRFDKIEEILRKGQTKSIDI